MAVTLYNQCRSGPSHRVRIALALKDIDYTYVAVDIRSGQQHKPDFLARNPLGLVPVLDVDGRVITQSGAIIEWLDEAHPKPALFPADPWGRAVVRSQAAIIGSDIQPLNNLRVQARLRSAHAADDSSVLQWTHHWIASGFHAFEQSVEKYGGDYCFGDSVTIADIYLVPQASMAERLGFDVDAFPHIAAVLERTSRLAPFAAARPEAQPDWS